MSNSVKVTEVNNKVVVSTPGPQGPRGKTILNGSGAPANNFGLEGDFYYDTTSTDFYGPKLSSLSWEDASVIRLYNTAEHTSYNWELSQLTIGEDNLYRISIQHNLGFSPNATIKSSAGDILETGIDYDDLNTITLIMAQPFSGTVYLS